MTRPPADGPEQTKPRLLDLFSGAGGAAKGYQRAGFYVVGVDIAPQPNYCGDEFVQMDALEAFEHFGWGEFDAIHASPPCQHYSVTSSLHDSEHPDLYDETKALLKDTGLPWVMENVIGAPYGWGVVLCGGMFGLRVRRHRNFEASFLLTTAHHKCPPEPIDVTGTGGRSERKDKGGGNHRKPANLDDARDAMGIDWMTRRELGQAVPPAYTEFIGTQLLAHISAKAENP